MKILITGISGTEADLAIFTSSALSGPWTELATTVAAAGKLKTLAQRGEQMLEGWMVGRDGEPLTSGSVRATLQLGAGTAPYSKSLLGNGWYRLEGLPAGNYSLQFSGFGYVSEYWEDQPSSGSADLVSTKAWASRICAGSFSA